MAASYRGERFLFFSSGEENVILSPRTPTATSSAQFAVLYTACPACPTTAVPGENIMTE